MIAESRWVCRSFNFSESGTLMRKTSTSLQVKSGPGWFHEAEYPSRRAFIWSEGEDR
jgi:hypothetical protein